MSKKTYVGYDLGDGETITDSVTMEPESVESKTDFDSMTMPDTVTPGKAMPTVFALSDDGDVIFSQSILTEPQAVKKIIVNFKRHPSDLLKGASVLSAAEQIDFLKKSSGWPSASAWAEGNGPEILAFKDSVITFTNAIFTDDNYRNRLKSAARDSREIVFCVGHPTNWTELDVAIYELILRNSILGKGIYEGKKSSMIMEAESRAAFLYARDLKAFGKLPRGSSVLLIDVGSSTIDITAMTAASNNCQYNSGSNYLGARSIDFMIRNWYLDKLREQPASWAVYQSMLENNATIPNALTLACRKAKEELYSSTKGKSVIHFGLMGGIPLDEEELDKMIETTPVADILKTTINLNDGECGLMRDKSWKELFREFLTEKKADMARKGIKIGFVILTGSASRMPFVPQIVSEVFREVSSDGLKYDMDPSRTISKGLALVGSSDEKSKAFQEDLNHLIDEKLEKIVETNIPALGEKMGIVIFDILAPGMMNRILSWKYGDIKTLNEMNGEIIRDIETLYDMYRKNNDDCSENNLMKLLADNPLYTEVIKKWLENEVGKDIAVELKELCEKYGVREISIDDLNIMAMPKISIDETSFDSLNNMNDIPIINAFVFGVIAEASIMAVMETVTVVTLSISDALADFLFIALMAMGPAGLIVIAAVLGITIGVLDSKNFEIFKESFRKSVKHWNLPEIARETMTDEMINQSLLRANPPQHIKNAFKNEELKRDIVKKVSANLKGQIEKRAEDIRYAIESG